MVWVIIGLSVYLLVAIVFFITWSISLKKAQKTVHLLSEVRVLAPYFLLFTSLMWPVTLYMSALLTKEMEKKHERKN